MSNNDFDSDLTFDRLITLVIIMITLLIGLSAVVLAVEMKFHSRIVHGITILAAMAMVQKLCGVPEDRCDARYKRRTQLMVALAYASIYFAFGFNEA